MDTNLDNEIVIDSDNESVIVEDGVTNDTIVEDSTSSDVVDAGNVLVVNRSYTGVNTDNIEMNVDNTNRTISATIVQIQYTSKLNFPNVGSERIIYIDTTENATYRWDAENLSYVCVGRDYNEIEILSGGNA